MLELAPPSFSLSCAVNQFKSCFPAGTSKAHSISSGFSGSPPRVDISVENRLLISDMLRSDEHCLLEKLELKTCPWPTNLMARVSRAV